MDSNIIARWPLPSGLEKEDVKGVDVQGNFSVAQPSGSHAASSTTVLTAIPSAAGTSPAVLMATGTSVAGTSVAASVAVLTADPSAGLIVKTSPAGLLAPGTSAVVLMADLSSAS
ncbi:uncharacterized protein LOC119768074 [Culex quinquefasciatus]|uniref:uncharacterized protein LOC119768074 n=1 Tax=Culex quinquefasciatus TaxID=7176 RepID=UPI0018E3D14B|nr:uncharacterized protein LOC119768074 [Culex quinquefasciatus]